MQSKAMANQKYNKIYLKQQNKTNFSNYMSGINQTKPLIPTRHSIEEGTMQRLLPMIKETKSNSIAGGAHL